MAKLLYFGIGSLDGYVADENGRFDWAEPDHEVHAAANDVARPIGTYLYGRRMYDVMSFWASPEAESDPEPVMQDYTRIWRAAEKVVFSMTLAKASTDRTRIERSFDPRSIAQLKRTAADDLSVGGAHLAAQAIAAGLVDEYIYFAYPVVVGGGTPFFPRAARLDLELVDVQAFGNGAVSMRYRSLHADQH